MSEEKTQKSKRNIHEPGIHIASILRHHSSGKKRFSDNVLKAFKSMVADVSRRLIHRGIEKAAEKRLVMIQPDIIKQAIEEDVELRSIFPGVKSKHLVGSVSVLAKSAKEVELEKVLKKHEEQEKKLRIRELEKAEKYGEDMQKRRIEKMVVKKITEKRKAKESDKKTAPASSVQE